MSNITQEILIEKLLKTLEKVEERGDIVITTTIPSAIVKTIISDLTELLPKNYEDWDFLTECHLPYLLEETAERVASIFLVGETRAREITNTFYHRLLQRLTLRQTAEFISHETPFEIALLSYYCVELKNCDGRDLKYLDWRKKYYQRTSIDPNSGSSTRQAEQSSEVPYFKNNFTKLIRWIRNFMQ